MGIGNVFAGFSQARDNRVANKKAGISNANSSTSVKPAEGVGGTPVTNTGSTIKPGDKEFVGPVQAKSLGSKIGQGIKSGVKNMLGFANGGRITKSGVAFVHRGETIIPANKTKERKALRVSTRRSSSR